jgi:hypothetical protein
MIALRTCRSWLLLPVLLRSPLPAAEVMVPAAKQVEFFVKIWAMDRSLARLPRVVVIIYQSRYRESLVTRNGIADAVARSGHDVRCIDIDVGDGENLEAKLAAVQADGAYIAPLRAVEITEIVSLVQKRGLRTMNAVPGYVGRDVAVAVILRGNRPAIHIDLNAARAEGSDYSSELLKATVLR